MWGFSLHLLQSSWMLRFVPKAVIFDEERGKMAVLNSVESTIPETLSGQDSYSTSVLVRLGCLFLLQYFILNYQWSDLPKLQSCVVNPVPFFWKIVTSALIFLFLVWSSMGPCDTVAELLSVCMAVVSVEPLLCHSLAVSHCASPELWAVPATIKWSCLRCLWNCRHILD